MKCWRAVGTCFRKKKSKSNSERGKKEKKQSLPHTPKIAKNMEFALAATEAASFIFSLSFSDRSISISQTLLLDQTKQFRQIRNRYLIEPKTASIHEYWAQAYYPKNKKIKSCIGKMCVYSVSFLLVAIIVTLIHAPSTFIFVEKRSHF